MPDTCQVSCPLKGYICSQIWCPASWSTLWSHRRQLDGEPCWNPGVQEDIPRYESVRCSATHPLMALSSGRSDITIGLLDGPVAMDHPDLAQARLQALTASAPAACMQANSAACRHGTLVAGILCGPRHSSAPAICPGCTLLVRPVFAETPPDARPGPGRPLKTWPPPSWRAWQRTCRS